jgi:RNA polymerase sigma-70 factor, ECF subfamily
MEEDNNNDLTFINSALSGDKNAYGAIINIYKNRVFNLVFKMTNNYHETEDIVQETFIKAYRGLRTFKVKQDFFPWICSIALNITRNRLRRKSILSFFSLDGSQAADSSEGRVWKMPDNSLNPEETLIKKEQNEKLNQIIYALPAKYREIFLLRNLEDMSYSEIARVTGLPLGTIEIRLHRALKILTESYKNIFELK